MTEFEILEALKPPLELLDLLDRFAERKPLPAAVAEYRRRWGAVNAGEPIPGFDLAAKGGRQ